MPVSATFAGGAAPILVTFDRPLHPEYGLPLGAWFARRGSYEQVFSAVSAAGQVVTLERSDGSLSMGADAISYDGTSPLLRSLHGVKVPAFADFPIT